MSLEDQLSTARAHHRSEALLDMEKLEAILYPTELQTSPHLRVVLVSIDVEYDSRVNDIDQIGLATLASTALLETSVDNYESRTLVASHLFLLKRHYIPRNTYTRHYLYRTAQQITAVNLSDMLAAILTPINNSREVLVGHNIKAGISVLKRYCGLDLETLPCIATTVDTACIPSYLHGPECRKVTLKHACQLMGISGKQFHNAGNDAYYTLKVLILSFRLHKQRETLRNPSLADRMRVIWERRLKILERVGKDNAVVVRPPEKIRDPEHRHDTEPYDDCESIFGLATLDIFGDTQELWTDQSRYSL